MGQELEKDGFLYWPKENIWFDYKEVSREFDRLCIMLALTEDGWMVTAPASAEPFLVQFRFKR